MRCSEALGANVELNTTSGEMKDATGREQALREVGGDVRDRIHGAKAGDEIGAGGVEAVLHRTNDGTRGIDVDPSDVAEEPLSIANDAIADAEAFAELATNNCVDGADAVAVDGLEGPEDVVIESCPLLL